MKTVSELRSEGQTSKLIIHSLDMSLYQASAVVDGREHLVTDDDGRPLRAFNKLELLSLLRNVPAQERVLRHQSAYDEMINQPVRLEPNTLEVPLGGTGFAAVR